jgi:uncharacterized protein YndB with AHSA1/START domain
VTSVARYVLELDRRYVLPAGVEEVWARLADVESFPTWWRWLRDFRVEGDGLRGGTVLHGSVVPPVPYRFRVQIHLEEVEVYQSISARLSGDLTGPARVELAPHPDGCEVAASWAVEMRKPSMRAAARIARPVLVWGHDQVVTTTVRRFRTVLH